MKMGVGQLICLVAGVFLLALGSGLAGGRWAIQRHGLATAQPSGVDQISDELKPAQLPASTPSESKLETGSGDETTLSSVTADQSLPSSSSDASIDVSVDANAAGVPGDKQSKSLLRYVVQAVSTPSRNDASAARHKIINAGYPAGIFEVDLGERGKWYRVYIGPYDTEAEAQEVLALVRQIPGFASCFVKPLE